MGEFCSCLLLGRLLQKRTVTCHQMGLSSEVTSCVPLCISFSLFPSPDMSLGLKKKTKGREWEGRKEKKELLLFNYEEPMSMVLLGFCSLDYLSKQ